MSWECAASDIHAKKTNRQEASFFFLFYSPSVMWIQDPPPPPPTLPTLPSFSLTLSICGSIRFTSNHFYSEGHPNVCQGFQVYLHNTVSALLAHFFLSRCIGIIEACSLLCSSSLREHVTKSAETVQRLCFQTHSVWRKWKRTREKRKRKKGQQLGPLT